MNQRFNFSLLLLVVLAVVTSVFQNCAQMGFQTNESLSLPMNHPPVELASQQKANDVLVDSKAPLLSRRQLENSLARAFLGNSFEHPLLAQTLNIIRAQTHNQQSLFGGGCDLNREKGFEECTSQPTLQNTPYHLSATVLREGTRLNLCQALVLNDQIRQTLVDRIRGPGQAPEPQNLERLVTAFFVEPNAELTRQLVTTDRELALRAVSIVDRWRTLILLVCEAPGWEVL